MRNWHDLLPHHVALEQSAWERRQRVLRAIRAGMKPQELASILRVGRTRVVQLQLKAERDKRSPVEWYCRTNGEIAALADRLKRIERRHRQAQAWL